jgi:AraC-like DNA-binding protein
MRLMQHDLGGQARAEVGPAPQQGLGRAAPARLERAKKPAQQKATEQRNKAGRDPAYAYALLARPAGRAGGQHATRPRPAGPGTIPKHRTPSRIPTAAQGDEAFILLALQKNGAPLKHRPPDADTIRQPLIEQGRALVRDAHHQVGDLAGLCELDRSTVERAFRQRFPFSLREFLRFVKLEAIKPRLGRQKIEVIAKEESYASASNLIRAWRKVYGDTPCRSLRAARAAAKTQGGGGAEGHRPMNITCCKMNIFSSRLKSHKSV